MINLLPLEQKKELRQEEILKLVLILGIIFLAFLISLTLILYLIKISFLIDFEFQKISFEERKKEIEKLKIQELKEKIKNYNLIISQLESFYQRQVDLTSILEKILETFPEKIYLTSFNFNSQNFQFFLTGFSPNREILLQFKKNLEERSDFLKEIYFPPANWLKTTDINFSVNFKIK